MLQDDDSSIGSATVERENSLQKSLHGPVIGTIETPNSTSARARDNRSPDRGGGFHEDSVSRSSQSDLEARHSLQSGWSFDKVESVGRGSKRSLRKESSLGDIERGW